MRNTSRVLGIIGAAISFLLGIFFIFPRLSSREADSLIGDVFFDFGVATIIAGVLGLVGGIIVKCENVSSGILMIFAAVVSLFALFNIASMTLFIIGAVLAFKREPQMVMVPYPAYPPQYYPYPPQPYPPQAVPYPPYPEPPVQNPPQPPQQQ